MNLSNNSQNQQFRKINLNSNVNKSNNNLSTFDLNSDKSSYEKCPFNKEKIVLINNVSQTCKIVENILANQLIISLDCEGVLLSKEGKLTLLQIGVSTGEVYVFDILKGGSLMFSGLDTNTKRGLKFILENSKILKIIHDCRSDWESLLHQYDIRLFNFIDSQELYFIYKLIYNQEVVKPISLVGFLEEITGEKLVFKDSMKIKFLENPNLWEKRPIEMDDLYYAAEDVAHLINSWFVLKSCLNENLLEMTYFLSILKVVNKSLYSEFQQHLISSVLLFIKTFSEKEEINEDTDSVNSCSDLIYSDFFKSNNERIKNENDNKILEYLLKFDYVDNFFQLKLLYSNSEINSDKENDEKNNFNHNSTEYLVDGKENENLDLNLKFNSKEIINTCLYYKNIQRDQFNKILQNS